MKKKFYLLPLLAVLLGLFSCSQENKLDEELNPSKKATGYTVTFSVEAPKTRAGQSGNTITTPALPREQAIKEIYVVVFEKSSGNFFKIIQATPQGNQPTADYKFDMLQAGEFEIRLVANPDANFVAQLKNLVSKNQLAEQIATQTPGEDNEATNFLMTSDFKNVTTTAGETTPLGEIALTRAAARFDFFNIVKGLKMTKITYTNRATNTYFATPTNMDKINLEAKEYDLTALASAGPKPEPGKYDNSVIGTIYGYENKNEGNTLFTLEGTYKGKPIKPQNISIGGIAVQRNHLYSIIIREGDNEPWVPGDEAHELKIKVIVNDWDQEGTTIEWKDDNIVNKEVPSFTVSGSNISTIPAASGSEPVENPTEVKVNQYTATTVTIHVVSAASASSELTSLAPLPPGYKVEAGEVGNKDNKLTQTFTITLPENTSTEKSIEFTLSNIFNSSASHKFTLKHRGQQDRPKMAIEYVADRNLADGGRELASDNSTTTSGYFDWRTATTMQLPDGYKLPSKEEWTGIFPYGGSYLYFGSTNSYNDISEQISVQGVDGGAIKTYTSDYRNRGGKISYALRFKGGDKTMLAAYRYEKYGPFTSDSNSGIKVTVRYLGDSFTGTVETIANEDYWNSNAGDDVSREFPACGYKTSGSLYNRGTYGGYWSATEYSSGHAWRVHFGSSSAVVGNYSSKTLGFTVRPFVQE